MRFTPVLAALLAAGAMCSITVGARADHSDQLVHVNSTSWLYRHVADAPVADDSDTIVAMIDEDVRKHWNGVAALNVRRYGVNHYRAKPSTPRQDVAFSDCQKKGYTPRAFTEAAAQVPIPADAAEADLGRRSWDGNLTIHDPATDTLWEFWRARKDAATGRWSACWGGRIDHVSRSAGIFTAPTGQAASGLTLAGGAVSVEEARHGRIGHAVCMVAIHTRRSVRSWPANRTDGWSDRAGAVELGRRLRLPASLDVDSLGLTRVGAAIARAAQTHGLVVCDTAGAVGFYGQTSDASIARGTGDPWDDLLSDNPHDPLRGFPWAQLEVLPMDWGKNGEGVDAPSTSRPKPTQQPGDGNLPWPDPWKWCEGPNGPIQCYR